MQSSLAIWPRKKSVYSTISATNGEGRLHTHTHRTQNCLDLVHVTLETKPDASTGAELFMQGMSFIEGWLQLL